MKRSLILTAVVSSSLTGLAFWSMGMAKLPSTVKLENKRVKITEVTYEPGVPRERYIRPTEKLIRERKSGEVLWHDKGEDAPVLVNLGKKAYRTLVIEVK
jgi:hypothetical protein